MMGLKVIHVSKGGQKVLLMLCYFMEYNFDKIK